MAEQIPERDLDAGEGVVGLQQVEAVAADQARDPRDVRDIVERLAEHGIQYRLTSAVRARADRGGDRGEGRGLAFAPPDLPAAGDPRQQRVPATRAPPAD